MARWVRGSATEWRHMKRELNQIKALQETELPTGGSTGQVLKKDSGSDYDVSWQDDATGGGGGLSEYMVAIWAEENATLADNTYEWAFGNGANTPTNNGISIYVPSGMNCHIVAMTGTTNNASGNSVIEANVNGSVLGVSDGVEVTLSGRSGVNDSFAAYAISSGDRLTFRTRIAGTNSGPNAVCAWLRYTSI
jgi:hypothetical protein